MHTGVKQMKVEPRRPLIRTAINTPMECYLCNARCYVECESCGSATCDCHRELGSNGKKYCSNCLAIHGRGLLA